MARCAYLGVACVLLSSLGCGSGGQNGAYNGPLGTVSGKLIVNGAPIPEGCKIMFQGVEPGGYIAVATVKSDGKYTLTYNGSFNIPAVKYKIQLAAPDVKVEVPPSQSRSTELVNPSEMARKVMGPPGSRKVQESAKLPFPDKYLSTTTSKLDYQVKQGPNTADFDLSP